MAVTPTTSERPGFTSLTTWALTSANATGVGVQIPGAADRSIQFSGTWGSATAALEGSNDSTTGSDGTWGPLTSASSGAAITATADANIAQVVENPLWVRAKLTTAGTLATVTAYLLSRTT
jgi:hypothetical protein